MALDLISSVFEDGGELPGEYTCSEGGTNPPLYINGVPEDAESLMLVVVDPDSKEDTAHWIVWNIDPKTEYIEEGFAPEDSIEGYNDFGLAEYGGDCPSDGDHRYQYHLYALDEMIDLDEDSTRKQVEQEVAGHIIDEAVLTSS